MRTVRLKLRARVRAGLGKNRENGVILCRKRCLSTRSGVSDAARAFRPVANVIRIKVTQ